ncbi:MAG: HD domain-containing phosphohydrolase, partial [Candidatus Acidiferrales bacterium]
RDLHAAYCSRSGEMRPALQGVGFEVRQGEFLGIVGESGSGKSTLAATILRLLPANGRITRGSILFRGKDILQADPEELAKIRGGSISLIFQEPSAALHPTMSIGNEIEAAALLHDLGKVGIPDAILRKPARLDPDEYALMKKHPEFGWAVLNMLPGFEHAALHILHHHESFDGTGYPASLKGSEIPIASRIVSVIDAFDAMVSSRPYRKGLPLEEAVRRLNLASGTQFDPVVVQSFLSFAQAEMDTVFAAAGTSVASAL